MKKRTILLAALLALICLVFVLGFFVGFVQGAREAGAVFLSNTDAWRYSTYVSEAAIHHRILRDLRKGDLQRVQHATEVHIDLNLKEAATITNVSPRLLTACITTDWIELKEDRAKYPRRLTNAASEIWINKLLDRLIQENQPQPAGGAYVSPAAGETYAHP